jgi:hypothetical protein
MLRVEDGGSRFLRNVGKLLPRYTASQVKVSSGGKASDLYSGCAYFESRSGYLLL